MKTRIRPKREGDIVTHFEMIIDEEKGSRVVSSVEAEKMTAKCKCGGSVYRLMETFWGQWYVCGKCTADHSNLTGYRGMKYAA